MNTTRTFQTRKSKGILLYFDTKREEIFYTTTELSTRLRNCGKLNFEGILSFQGILYQTSAKMTPLLNNVVISIHRGKIRLSVREAVRSDRVACFVFVSFQHLSSEKNENKAGRLVT